MTCPCGSEGWACGRLCINDPERRNGYLFGVGGKVRSLCEHGLGGGQPIEPVLRLLIGKELRKGAMEPEIVRRLRGAAKDDRPVVTGDRKPKPAELLSPPKQQLLSPPTRGRGRPRKEGERP